MTNPLISINERPVYSTLENTASQSNSVSTMHSYAQISYPENTLNKPRNDEQQGRPNMEL